MMQLESFVFKEIPRIAIGEQLIKKIAKEEKSNIYTNSYGKLSCQQANQESCANLIKEIIYNHIQQLFHHKTIATCKHLTHLFVSEKGESISYYTCTISYSWLRNNKLYVLKDDGNIITADDQTLLTINSINHSELFEKHGKSFFIHTQTNKDTACTDRIQPWLIWQQKVTIKRNNICKVDYLQFDCLGDFLEKNEQSTYHQLPINISVSTLDSSVSLSSFKKQISEQVNRLKQEHTPKEQAAPCIEYEDLENFSQPAIKKNI